MVGIEPTTYGLRNRCSTTELHWQFRSKTAVNTADYYCSRRRAGGTLRRYSEMQSVGIFRNTFVRDFHSGSQHSEIVAYAVALVKP